MKISTKQYAEVLYDLTLNKSQEDVSVVVEKFTKELIKNNQVKLVPKIIERFEKIYNEKNGIILAELTTATRLGPDEIENIRKYLLKKYSAKEIVLNNKIDKNIKGGVIIKVGDDLIDVSVAGKLRALRRNLNN